jgi:cytochrome c
MKNVVQYLVFALFTWIAYSFLPKGTEVRVRVLVFSKTAGWHHESIPKGILAINKIGEEVRFDIDTTTDSNRFRDDKLKNYAAVIFNNTTGNVLNAEQQAAFERYIQAGGGFVGIHAAADTEPDWPWYGKLLGAWFESHPSNPNIRKAIINIVDTTHSSTKMLPTRLERTDEWYNYKSIYNDIHILAALDETSYEGGTNGSKHPLSWYHQFDGGRAFYTGMGHSEASYADTQFLKHLAGGIQYAIGQAKVLDYTKAYAVPRPDQNRFNKTVLVRNLASPMELATSVDGKIYFTELLGNLSVYDTKTNRVKLVSKIPVTNIGGTGLIGVALDPKFIDNGYIYLYYAPQNQSSEPIYFNLSRFIVTKNDRLDVSSEKILLRVGVQKNSGSHHGGSLAWDVHNNLYLSTGDGSAPFASNGYAPLDERKGNEYYSLDAQRSAANTNDFKGKILRIHPEADGSYTIPKENLFPMGMKKTRPEIYVMGVRNPYRIAIHPKTSTLYWGDIGPDAGKDSPRGPRGYDEFNQAKKAGNYGWPYFVANNLAYAKWNFETNEPGPNFQASAPINQSPNNTGINLLPPAVPAMIWYPYEFSEDFPEFGVGGRCAIAGTFYQYKSNIGSPNKFPQYYDGNLFVADWMRNWLMNLHFDSSEKYMRCEPFMQVNGDFKRPIDITFGADGLMYLLEYGSVYGAANKDARLVKIEYYRGNRAPKAKAGVLDSLNMDSIYKHAALTSDVSNISLTKKVTGRVPLKLSFTGKSSIDLDDDDTIAFKWTVDGKTIGTASTVAHLFTKPGNYQVVLQVSDRSGLLSKDTVHVKAGNTAPKIYFQTFNSSFNWNTKPFQYSVVVTDKEDKKIDRSKVKVHYLYSPSGFDKDQNIEKLLGQQELNHEGKKVITNSDCNSCHTLNRSAVGPSYTAISVRYKNNKGAIESLAQKVINGGGGNWSKTHVMSAHPQLSVKEAQEAVRYVLSVTDKKKGLLPLPQQASLSLTKNLDQSRGEYLFIATYTDNGGNKVGPIKSTETMIIQSSKIKAAFADEHPGFARFRDNLTEGGHKSYLLFRQIDLTNIRALGFVYSSKEGDGEIEVRIDSKAGRKIGQTPFGSTSSFEKFASIESSINTPVKGKHDVYIIAIKHKPPNDAIIRLEEIEFKY